MVEDGKWLLEVTPFECTNSAFNITNENNPFSFSIPVHRQTKFDEKTMDGLNELLELRSQNGFELFAEQVRKKV